MIFRIFKSVTKSVYDSQKMYRKRCLILEPVVHKYISDDTYEYTTDFLRGKKSGENGRFS